MVAEFSIAVASANGIAEIRQILLQTVSKFGYSHFVYSLRLADHNITDFNTIVIHTLGTKWMQSYQKNQYFRDNYISDHLAGGTGPLIWSDMFVLLRTGGLEDRYHKTMQGYWDFGWRNGVTMPLGLVRNYRAGMSFIADPAVSTEEHNRSFAAHKDVLLRLMTAFHEHVDRPRFLAQHLNLSVREIEALDWMSQGYQVKEIAEKLGNSPHTVSKQIISARNKLYSQTGAQAVAKAVMLGII